MWIKSNYSLWKVGYALIYDPNSKLRIITETPVILTIIEIENSFLVDSPEDYSENTLTSPRPLNYHERAVRQMDISCEVEETDSNHTLRAVGLLLSLW